MCASTNRHRTEQLRQVWVAALGAVAFCLFPLARPAHATFPYARHRIVGSVHDFVANGFTGGGSCAGCHIPHNASAAGRLYPTTPGTACGTFPDTPRLQCMDCHCDADGNGWGQLPATPEWAGYTRLPPASGLHALDAAGDSTCRPGAADAGQAACTTTCHRHDDAFIAPPCLDCHTAVVAGVTPRGGLGGGVDIDGMFEAIGNDAGPGQPVWSQHNVNYAVNGTNARREGPDQNQCKHCHGLTHPSDGDLLRVPAPIPANPALGTPVARACTGATQNLAAYQNFCLACHNGQNDAAVFGVRFSWPAQTIPNTHLSGTLGASSTTQVPPSLRANPAQQQGVTAATGLPTAAAGWVVPAVPPLDVNATPPYLTALPYFSYYELNGHGAPLGFEGNPRFTMDVSCLANPAGTPITGCHVSHGMNNRFLLSPRFGAGIAAAAALAPAVCLGCHAATHGANNLSRVANATPPRPFNMFHTWSGPDVGLVFHDNNVDGNQDGMIQWRIWTQATTPGNRAPGMDIAASFTAPLFSPPPYVPVPQTLPTAYAVTGILPFYDAAAELHQRDYTPQLGTSWAMCLSCHDPHGTATTQTEYTWATPPTASVRNTRGMPRKFPVTFGYDDELCSECHSQ